MPGPESNSGEIQRSTTRASRSSGKGAGRQGGASRSARGAALARAFSLRRCSNTSAGPPASTPLSASTPANTFQAFAQSLDRLELVGVLIQGGSGTEPEPGTGTVGTVFPETERGTRTAGTVFQEPKPEPVLFW